MQGHKPSASASGLYGRRWRKARRLFLAENPLCRMCEADGRVTPAAEVHHRVKHNGSSEVFWQVEHWEPICALHHRSTVARMERSGKVSGCDVNGHPLDHNHYWASKC